MLYKIFTFKPNLGNTQKQPRNQGIKSTKHDDLIAILKGINILVEDSEDKTLSNKARKAATASTTPAPISTLGWTSNFEPRVETRLNQNRYKARSTQAEQD